MRKAILILVVAGVWLHAQTAFAEIKFTSSKKQVQFVELFSSEARKGSPAAEAWISDLKDSPDLWKRFVPLVYHVDYGEGREWWHDKFAKKEYTERLLAYAHIWGEAEPYVPTLVVNGTEWSGWVRGDELPPLDAEAGLLTAKKFSLDTDEIRVLFEPAHKDYRRWIAHAALLGSGFVSEVGRGDNIGKTLVHDFVVLERGQASMTLKRDGFQATIDLPIKTSFSPPDGLAIVVWVTDGDAIFPAQCTGGYLKSPD